MTSFAILRSCYGSAIFILKERWNGKRRREGGVKTTNLVVVVVVVVMGEKLLEAILGYPTVRGGVSYTSPGHANMQF